MKILIVKLSSLGDVLHNLPIVWDLRAKYPNAQIDWVVEEGYVDLLQPLQTKESFKGIDTVIALSLRRWKTSLKKGEFVKSISEYLEFKRVLQKNTYDLVIETQGLIKSAFVARLAKRSQRGKIFGLGNQTEFSGYEPLAKKFYTDLVEVPLRCHAVDRSRSVTAIALGLPVPDCQANPPKFYPSTYVEDLKSKQLSAFINERDVGFDLSRPYVLCFHSTARESKRWGDEKWVEIGQYLLTQGLQVIFPWGNAQEKELSLKLAAQINLSNAADESAQLEECVESKEYFKSKACVKSIAIVPNRFSVRDAFLLIAGARLTIGVDTGLTHLSAILNQPTIELYCDSPKWKTQGYWSPLIENLGDRGQPPEVDEVIASIKRLLEFPC